ncbi:MAG TPA: phosphatase PAP2 family protein [Stellaceae bacterium]|nr:phosphatase PAP2 family protein [Stellaceae bacterium]
MTQNTLVALTNFGDLAVLLPLVAVVLLWLRFARSKRDAFWWVLTAGFCMGATALLKIAFFVCPPADALHSPSGHTSLSTLVYGGLALLAAADTKGWRRAAIILAAVAAIGAIAISRVLLSSHTWIEVALGLLIGASALAVLSARFLSGPRAGLSVGTLVLAAALVVAVFHGRQLHAESLFRAIGVEMQGGGLACS